MDDKVITILLLCRYNLVLGRPSWLTWHTITFTFTHDIKCANLDILIPTYYSFTGKQFDCLTILMAALRIPMNANYLYSNSLLVLNEAASAINPANDHSAVVPHRFSSCNVENDKMITR